MSEMTFQLVGGPCDGEFTRQSVPPPPWIKVQPRIPLPKIAEFDRIENGTEPITSVVYHRWIWQDGVNRWYDYRIEKPDS